MKKIVVIGSTGTIGKAVIAHLDAMKYEVTGASRSTVPSVDIEKPSSIESFFSEIDTSVDGVICAAGNAAFGAFESLTDDKFRLSLDSKLMGQVNLIRKGFPYVKEGGVFILTGGMLAHQPWPETSAISMVNAGLDGFVKGAALDIGKSRRVVIVHPPLVRETAVLMGMNPQPWPTAEDTAKTYAAALSDTQTGMAYFVEGYYPPK